MAKVPAVSAHCSKAAKLADSKPAERAASQVSLEAPAAMPAALLPVNRARREGLPASWVALAALEEMLEVPLPANRLVKEDLQAFSEVLVVTLVVRLLASKAAKVALPVS